MSTTLKKASAIGLSLTTSLWLAGSVFVPVAGAATAEELQAQIAQLLAQIQQLQSQLSVGAGATVSSVPTVTRNLTVGSRGDDVKELQQFLNAQGYTIAQSGAGAPGSETTYFGPLTRSSLSRFQAAKNITPSVGYFGPKTRAYLSSLAVAPGTPVTPGTPGTPVTPGTPGTPVTPAPASGLAVSLASDNPVAGALISSSGSAAARVETLKVSLTAGTAGAIKVTGLKFKKTGVVSDTAISSAYLVESGKVLTQFNSISSGVITFSGLDLSIDAGKTRSFTFAIDPSTGLTAGNTIAFALNAASDVTAEDSAGTAVTPSGAFPMNGNVFTVTSVSNPSLATLTVASSTVGTSVYAGTTNVQVSQWTVTAANSPVLLKSIKFTVVGSAAKSDLKNVMLLVNGTQVGSTLASVGSDGSAYFDLTANPVRFNTGSANMEVKADIMGSPSFNFDFGILNTFDVLAGDANYNTNVSVTVTGGGTGSTSGHQITINQGSITVTSASDTPTGNIALGASGVTFAKFNIYAAGEPVKVKFLDARLATNTTNASGSVQNVYLSDDQGVQIGSTISSIVDGSSSGQCTVAALNLTCHFGTTSSNINYIIPANTTRVISLKGDVLSTATGWTTITGSLPGNTSNLQGQTSSQTANSGSATGAALTLATSPLTASINGAVGSQTYALGASNKKIGSYVFTASAAEGVKVSNMTITTSASSTNFQNLMVKVDGVQFGTTQSTLTASQSVSFSGSSPIIVPAGGSKTIDVFADALSSATAGLKTALTTLASCTGVGATTFTSISCAPTSIAGQNVTLSTGPSLTIARSSASAATKQVVMGSTNNSLATFRLTETANVEGIKLQTFRVTATSTGGNATVPSFTNVSLYKGTGSSATLVAGPVSASSTASNTWIYAFNFSTQPVIPQNGSLELEIRGDVADDGTGGAVSNKAYQFSIASSTADVIAYGESSNNALTGSTMTLSTPFGNNQTVLQSKLTLSASTIGATTSRTRSSADDIANIVFAADANFDVTLNSVTLTFTGKAVTTGTNFTASLIDPDTGAAVTGLSAASSTVTSAADSATPVFTFSTPYTVSRGTSKTLRLRLNSNNFLVNSQTNPNPSVEVIVNAASDIDWGDGSTTNGLSLEATAIPVRITNVSY